MSTTKRDLVTFVWAWAGTVSGGAAMAYVLMLLR